MKPEPTSSSALSKDIKLLGGLLGQIIREQEGEEALALVEEVRAAAKARRSGDERITEHLNQRVATLSLRQKQILIRAFSSFFQLMNIAEDQQRIRVLREREREGKLTESIGEALHSLKDRGMSADEVWALLDQLHLRFVLTAHPSESKRKEVLVKLRHIAHMLDEAQLIDPRLHEWRQREEHLAEEIEELWQTAPNKPTDRSVADEVDFGLYFMTSVIMDTVVHLYDEFYDVLHALYPERDWSDLHRLLRFGSWIGGDRDGNPNVTTQVTMDTLHKQRAASTRVYLDDLETLADHLTQAIVPHANLNDLAAIQGAEAIVAASPAEPYRAVVALLQHKLASNQYKSRIPLLDDLRVLQASLRQNGARRAAEGHLRRLMRKVRLFGLYLTPLDIREDSRLIATTLGELFKRYGICEDYQALSEAEKQAILNKELNNPRPLFPADTSDLSETAQRIIATWRMVASAHEQFSKGVIDTFIASMSQQPSDTLALLLMAEEVGAQDALDLVPLFETIDDLQRAPQVITALFENPAYQRHLKIRGARQQIMIGYSDSGKDGGYIASNWNLYTAQERLATVCDQHGIALELFHGRGGSIGRGGGPTNRAILSQPPASLRGGIKITEQGEVIAYRYGNAAIARRHFHQVLNAVILSLGNVSQYRVLPEWEQAMDALSEYGRQAYRSLVYETEGFLDYWQQATPIAELGQLRISSRPARRNSKGGFAAMRAIPWVFSWMQNRAIIPSWYGVGYAFQQFCEQQAGGLDLLKTMYKDWLFFRALIENAQLDVAKADMGIAALYASLVNDVGIREAIFGRIRAEHEQTRTLICAITEQPDLLANTPAIQTSIERRNPYVDPLNFIQVDLLRQLRGMSPDHPEFKRTLDAALETINGIASGMKTTG